MKLVVMEKIHLFAFLAEFEFIWSCYNKWLKENFFTKHQDELKEGHLGERTCHLEHTVSCAWLGSWPCFPSEMQRYKVEYFLKKVLNVVFGQKVKKEPNIWLNKVRAENRIILVMKHKKKSSHSVRTHFWRKVYHLLPWKMDKRVYIFYRVAPIAPFWSLVTGLTCRFQFCPIQIFLK